MKAKFLVGERILILGLLPSEANLVTLKIVLELKRKVGLTAEEFKSVEMVMDEEKQLAKWNSSKDLPVELEFAEVEVDVVRKALQKLDKEAKLTEQHLGLCEKFKV